MSLYQRKDSPNWWVKFTHNGRTIQRSAGTSDKSKAQEYHDKLKSSLWEQQRLGIKPSRTWKEAVVRWLAETSDKTTHREDIRKLRWLDSMLGGFTLDQVIRDRVEGGAGCRHDFRRGGVVVRQNGFHIMLGIVQSLGTGEFRLPFGLG